MPLKELLKSISVVAPEQIADAPSAYNKSGVGFTVKFNVAKESHPVTALVKIAVWLSDVVNVRPFQVYGSSVSQMVMSAVLVKVGSTVRFNVAKLSHPVTALVRVAVWLSVVVNVNPFQV